MGGGRYKILATGILFPHRRFEDIIEALALLVRRGYQPTLSIIGDTAASPAYYEKLKALAEVKGVANRVAFLGIVSESELIHAYHEHDVFVFSNYLQTWGLAPLEAMATGLPVIVSRGAGVHEVLIDHETAILINPKDPEELAAAIKEVMDTPALYEKLSKRGAVFVRSNFSWQRYTQELLHVFEETKKRQK
ncbi:MAG: glycosyltransferase family 4 protein [Candidatus Sungiibacteriota bacterium]